MGVVALVIVGLGIGGYAWARQVQSSAEAGKSSVKAGLDALQAGDGAKAQTDFLAAESSFASTQSLVGPAWLIGTPVLGRQLEAVDQLAEVGLEGSKAGQQMAELMLAASRDSSGGVNGLLKVAKPYVLAALDSFDRIAQVMPELTTDGLLPPVASAVTSAQAELAPLKPIFTKADSISTLVRYLLGSDHRFLVLSQNNAELRPTGGFLGSFGLLKVGPSGFKLESYEDIYTLPKDTLLLPKPAGARMGARVLRIQDANWWLDFPTSAQTILNLYDTMKQPKVDGVIAIDLVTIKTLLAEFGPITLKEYGKTITAENMIKTLVVMMEQERVLDGAHRKDALKPLSEELLHRMVSIKQNELVPTGRMVVDLANQKRLQFFVRDAVTQQALVGVGWSGAVDVPADTTDLLGISNAVVWPSKMNMGVHKTIDYNVTLSDSGTAQTQLTLGYQKDFRNVLKVQRQWFGNYLRVYRLDGVELTGWTSKRSMKAADATQLKAEIKPTITVDAMNLPAITAGFGLLPGETRTETYSSSVPSALVAGQAAALPNMPTVATSTGSTVMHYRLLIVKQPDLEENKLTVTVAVPQGWTIAGTKAWHRTSGEAVPVTAADGTVTLSTTLSADTVLDVTVAK